MTAPVPAVCSLRRPAQRRDSDHPVQGGQVAQAGGNHGQPVGRADQHGHGHRFQEDEQVRMTTTKF